MEKITRTNLQSSLLLCLLFSTSLASGGIKNPILSNPDWNYWRDLDKYNEAMTQIKTKVLVDPVLINFRRLQPKDNAASEHVSRALDALFVQSDSNQREAYRDFLNAVRTASETQLQEERKTGRPGGLSTTNTAQALRKLGEIIYTGTDLTEFNSRLTCTVSTEGMEKAHIPFKSQPPSTQKTIASRMNQLQKKIDSLTQIQEGLESNRQINLVGLAAQSWKGERTSADFDPNMEANLISVKARYTNAKNGKEMLALRMPTQTISSSEDKVKMTPEFRMYLSSLLSSGKKHTYINHQQLNDKQGLMWGLFSDEKHRSRKIHDLSDEYSNLIVISLNKNTSFYRQEKDWHKPMEFGDFKQEYLNILVPPAEKEEANWKETGIRLEDLWNPIKFGRPSSDTQKMREEARTYFSNLLDRLGTSIFGVSHHQFMLDPEKRQALIELSYHFISDYASRDSHSSNRSCKDAIDRGGGANALAYTITFMKEVCSPSSQMGIADFQKKMDAIPSMLLSDALQVRKRGIIDERLIYYQQAMKEVIHAVETRGCNSVFGKPFGLDEFFYMSQPRFGTQLAAVPSDERLRNSCQFGTTSPFVADEICNTEQNMTQPLPGNTIQLWSEVLKTLSESVEPTTPDTEFNNFMTSIWEQYNQRPAQRNEQNISNPYYRRPYQMPFSYPFY